MVRAKFKCINKKPNTDGPNPDGFTIEMNPVVGGSPENDSFYKWTPGGGLLLSTINLRAAEQFEVGKEYYLDITAAE